MDDETYYRLEKYIALEFKHIQRNTLDDLLSAAIEGNDFDLPRMNRFIKSLQHLANRAIARHPSDDYQYPEPGEEKVHDHQCGDM